MILANVARRHLAAAAMAAMIAISPAAAQDVSESHLKASRAAIAALGATAEFDRILPQAAQALKTEMINKNPDMVQIISSTVDEKAIGLAARRGDLEREAAVIYAKVFSEQELNEVAAFYTSATGKKLLQDGNIAFRELAQAAGVWQRGLARDLAQEVGTTLDAITKTQPAPVEADGAAAPAPGQPAVNQ